MARGAQVWHCSCTCGKELVSARFEFSLGPEIDAQVACPFNPGHVLLLHSIVANRAPAHRKSLTCCVAHKCIGVEMHDFTFANVR